MGMLFSDDVILYDETREGLISRVENWRKTFEPKGFRISRLKLEYVGCYFT